MTALSRFIATVGYVGYLRPAPGTWGSLAGLILAVPVIHFGGLYALALGMVIVLVIGHWATKEVTRKGPHDPSEVVIDEVLGQWTAVIPCVQLYSASTAWTVSATGFPLDGFWLSMGLAFLLFRLFDIWKPWPVSMADRHESPMGVMVDDWLAGMMAAIALFAITAALGLADFRVALW